MIGRAGGGAEGLHFGHQELLQASRVEQSLGFLEQVGFVATAAPFGDEHKLVLIPFGGVEIDLRREIAAGVLFVVHGQGNVLGITQIFFGVGLEDPFGEQFLVPGPGPYPLAFFADDGCRTGVLAEGQLELGRDFGVAQHGDGHPAIVGRGFGIGENLGDLFVVRGPQQKGYVAHGLVGQQGQAFRVDLEDFLTVKVGGADVILGQETVLGVVLTQRERVLILEFRHVSLSFFRNYIRGFEQFAASSAIRRVSIAKLYTLGKLKNI